MGAAAGRRPRAAGESVEGSREASMARSMWLSAVMWVARGEGARLAVSGNRRALGATGCWTGVNRADVAGAGCGVFRTENWWVALMKAKPRAMESVAVAQAV